MTSRYKLCRERSVGVAAGGPSAVIAPGQTSFDHSTDMKHGMAIPWASYPTHNDWDKKWTIVGTLQRLLMLLRAVFRLNTIVVMAVTCALIYVAGEVLGISYEADLTFLNFGIIFPMVFTLTSAYNRREKVVETLAGLKSSLASMYWIHRDYVLASNIIPESAKLQHVENAFTVVIELSNALRCFLQSSHETPPSHIDYYYDRVYRCLSQMTVLGQSSFLANSVNEASLFRYEVSRQKITEFVERARILRDYRTPRTLRHMTTLLLYAVPIGLAPHFSSYCEDNTAKTCTSAYFNACLYILVLFCVYNVVGDLESNYDSYGEDDVHFTITEEIVRLHHGKPSTFFSVNPSDGSYHMHNPLRFVHDPNGSLKLPPEELNKGMQEQDLDQQFHESQGTYMFTTESPAKTFALAKTIVSYTLDSTVSVASTAVSLPVHLVSSVDTTHPDPVPTPLTLPPIQRGPGSGDGCEPPHTPLTPM